MNRRQFIATGSAVGLGVAQGSAALIADAEPAAKSAAAPRALMKLGCQSGPSDEAHIKYLSRFGVESFCGAPKIEGDRLYATTDELKTLKDLSEKWKVSLDCIEPPFLASSYIDSEKHPAIMLAQSPERDRDIEAFQTYIKNCAAAGVPMIKYNMSILGVLRTGRIPGRGDAMNHYWKLSETKPEIPLTKAGRVDNEQFWERITYFLDRVVPVANEYKVRIACHPQDPGVPPTGYQGVHRVLGTVDGLKKFVSIQESPYHGLNFCQGTISEDLANPGQEIFDVIRYFGEQKKIFNVHFRNIRGHRDDFVETYPDEGDIDFLKAMKVYKEIGYSYMIMPDHVPLVESDPRGLQSFAFCYGYIRALIQSVNSMA